jgi:hypothetical protein
LPIDAEAAVERLMQHPAPRQQHGGLVGVITWVKYDHLVAGAHDGGDGVEQALRRTVRHRDRGLRIQRASVITGELFRDLLLQVRHAGHRCVLVLACLDVSGQGLDEGCRRIEIGEALPEVQRAGLLGKPRHHREDRGSDPGQLGLERDHGHHHIDAVDRAATGLLTARMRVSLVK